MAASQDPSSPRPAFWKRRTRSGRPLWLALGAALVTLAAVTGLYLSQRADKAALDSPLSPSGLVMPDQAKGTSLVSVGRTSGLAAPCTAWLLSAGDKVPAGQLAYAVTAGRCVGITDSTTVLTDQPLGGASVDFNAFASLANSVKTPLVTAGIGRVVWASMRWTDVAVLELDRTYADLAADGVAPIMPAAPARKDTDVLVAGAPMEGIPADQQFVRVAKCKIGATSRVLESVWVFDDMSATKCPGILGGSAGSPVFDPAGSAVGMVTTTSLGAPAGNLCLVGQPCSVTDSAVSMPADTSYVLGVETLSACFVKGSFTLGGQCRLEDPATVVAAAAPVRSGQPGADISVSISGKLRAKIPVANAVGDLVSMDCRNSAGWGRAVPETEWKLKIKLPGVEKWTLGCVGSPAAPTPVVLLSDGTPPDSSKSELSTDAIEGGVQVAPVLAPPELSEFFWTNGRSGKIDCATAEGYTKFTGESALIQADDLPSTVCLIAVDEAGNQSTPVAREVK